MASSNTGNGADASPSIQGSSAAPQDKETVLPNYLQPNDPARTGYDPSLRWWSNYMRVLSGSMTREGMERWREDRYRVNEEQDCKRCEDWRDWLFKYSPSVTFMRQKIEKLNGTLDASNVVCQRCPGRFDEDWNAYRQAGGFSPGHGILLCANELHSRDHMEEVITHEMVHAWDHLRWKVDWGGDSSKALKHAACTEIRASMLSGECRWARKGSWTKLSQEFQKCVRERAALSVVARPACKDDVHAAKVVDDVWESCFNDKRPFDEIYR